MARVRVLIGTLVGNRQRVKPGGETDLSDAEAAALQALGTVEILPAPAPAAPPEPEPAPEPTPAPDLGEGDSDGDPLDA